MATSESRSSPAFQSLDSTWSDRVEKSRAASADSTAPSPSTASARPLASCLRVPCCITVRVKLASPAFSAGSSADPARTTIW